jgi:hypothetical protein
VSVGVVLGMLVLEGIGVGVLVDVEVATAV